MTALPRSRSSRVAIGTAAVAALVAPLAAAAPAGAAHARRHAGDALPPRVVLARASAGLRSARVLALAGTVRLGTGHFSFHVESARDGAAARGALVSRTSRNGFLGRLDFVVRGGSVYVHAGAPFWRHEVAVGLKHLTAARRTRAEHLLATHWVEMTGTAAQAMRTSIGPLTSPAAFARRLLSPKALGALHEGRPTRFRHARALPLHSSRGGTVYVATKGATRPIGLVTSRHNGGGTVLFGYPRSLVVPRPAGAVTVARVVHAVAH